MKLATARWVVRLAWRDARASRLRLLLFVSAIVAGVAGLVAIGSFAESLQDAVDDEAKLLLGADLEVYSRSPFDAPSEALLASLDGDQARQVSFASMAFFPRTGNSRLVQIRAVDPAFPFYGRLETEPAAASATYQEGRGALVDETLMLQFGVEVGDVVRVGEVDFRIAGRLVRIPGEVPTASLIGPRVFIPRRDLDATALLGFGSRARYSAFFRLSLAPDAVDEWVGSQGATLRDLRLEAETVQFRQRSVGRGLDSLYRFLYLAALTALLLGGAGVASAVQLYARTKVRSVAVLRCLGAPATPAVAVFAFQSGVTGAIGALVGTALGIAVQAAIPAFLGGFLPVEVPFRPHAGAVLEGLITGVAVAIVFALLPLVSLRRITPLLALRAHAAAGGVDPRDPWLWGLAIALLGAVSAATAWHLDSWWSGLGVAASLVGALLALGGTALLMRALARRSLRPTWPYALRQGVANLYRPGNQTTAVLAALGFGVFVVLSLYLLQQSLLGSVESLRVAGDTNMVLFDIQPDQRDAVREQLLAAGIEIGTEMAVVPMRIAEIEGRSVAEIDDEDMPSWQVRREYSSSYSAELRDTEEVVAGEWTGAVDAAAGEPVPVSLDEDMARRLQLEVGDGLVFDVQGVPIRTRVGSLRRIDWQRVQPNFFVLFPTGVLEPAPQQWVMVARAPGVEASAQAQRAIVERFSNVAIMDLQLVLETVDSVLDSIALALRFMAGFSLAAGLIVMLVGIWSSRQQRLREAVLLRTLGASGRHVVQILVSEYALLGLLGAGAGVLLSIAGAWALARFLFEVPFQLGFATAPAVLAVVVVFTAVIGLSTSRGATRRSPLTVLRSRL